MIKLYKITLLVILLPLFSIAQSNYKPGAIVNPTGDTVHGLIDYREWNENPVAITFKKTLFDTLQKLTPDMISFFRIDELETYQSYTVSISLDPTTASNIPMARDTNFKIASVFLKLEQKGDKVILYSYADGLKARYYIAEPPEFKPVELISRIYYGKKNDPELNIVVENTYQKQLFAIASKNNLLNDNLIRTIEKCDYIEDDIVAIVDKINGLSKSSGISKKKKSVLQLCAGAGVNISNISVPPGSAFLELGGSGHTSFGPKIAVGLNAFVNPYTQKLVFRVEASLNTAQFKDSFTDKFSPYVPINYSYNQLAFVITPQAVYNIYNAEKLKFFVGAGLDINFYSYSNKVFKADNYSGSITTYNPFLFFDEASQIMFRLGAIIDKKFEIYGSYSENIPITVDPFFEENQSNIHVGLNYLFGK